MRNIVKTCAVLAILGWLGGRKGPSDKPAHPGLRGVLP